MKKWNFEWDEELGIVLPVLCVDYEELGDQEKSLFSSEATEKTASKIPSRIRELDKVYMEKYQEIEAHPEQFFIILDEMNRISKCISSLHIWFFKIEGYFLHSKHHG